MCIVRQITAVGLEFTDLIGQYSRSPMYFEGRAVTGSFDNNKRRFLTRQVPLALGLTATSQLARAGNRRSLYLYNLHTQERLECWYYSGGRYVPEALVRIDKLLRDHRTGEQHQIDVELLDTLFLLRRHFTLDAPVEIISGFRSASTNAMLRRQSQGVAKRSYHMLGRAVDCRFPGVSTADLRDAAIECGYGGVGYYRRSDFVHLDTGPIRYW